jgi:hypothetical protein
VPHRSSNLRVKKNQTAYDLLSEVLKPTTLRINYVLSQVDPLASKSQAELISTISAQQYDGKLLDSDPSLWTSRSIIFNRDTIRHRDVRDEADSWCAMLVLGKPHQSNLGLPTMNNILHYVPGTLVLLRGSRVEHMLLNWDNCYRVAIVHYTEKSVWRHFGILAPRATSL